MSAEENNGHTLEGIAQRLETLEHENAELRGAVAELGGSRLSGRDEEPERTPLGLEEGRVSRKGLLSKAGMAAAGLVVAGALTQRDIREAKAAPTIFTTDSANRGAIEATNTSATGFGVYAKSLVGVQGVSIVAGGAGLSGRSEGSTGIGIEAQSLNGGHGILASASDTDEVAGVRASGKTGVWGSTGAGGYSGVYGQHDGAQPSGGFGVVGDGIGSGRAGVLGRNPHASGSGVRGQSTNGYGGQFDGGKAQLRLNPKTTVGKPTTGAHTKGEIYMDSAGTLFVCTANGTPGTWRRFQTVAA
jgi:hypothetical protein